MLEAEAIRIHYALFTDVNMPGEMDGLALAHHARAHWPWISLLGDLGPGLSRGKRDARWHGSLIAKPYEFAQVIRHIREMRRSVA